METQGLNIRKMVATVILLIVAALFINNYVLYRISDEQINELTPEVTKAVYLETRDTSGTIVLNKNQSKPGFLTYKNYAPGGKYRLESMSFKVLDKHLTKEGTKAVHQIQDKQDKQDIIKIIVNSTVILVVFFFIGMTAFTIRTKEDYGSDQRGVQESSQGF